ncbi:MAG: C4-type zinc ribbon domain-containing protein [Candidatus Sumerlaeia bacterium]|nr:C4-type zinc ribbon domain-containing protein [Candidatus Sumerlaeia bacterium]
MNPEVTVLLDLQEIDRELLKLKEELGRYPGIWEKTKARVTDARQRAKSLADEIAEHGHDKRDLSRSLQETGELLRRYQLQQPMVKTQKEYYALTQQIEGTRERLSNIEEQARRELERGPELQQQLEAAEKEAKAAEEFAKGEKERIRVQMAEKREAVAKLETARAAVVAKVAPARLGQYERVAKRHPGSAIVPVRQGGCTGCNFQLLSKALVELHRAQKVAFCDHCGRILSHDESYQQADPQSAAG